MSQITLDGLDAVGRSTSQIYLTQGTITITGQSSTTLAFSASVLLDGALVGTINTDGGTFLISRPGFYVVTVTSLSGTSASLLVRANTDPITAVFSAAQASIGIPGAQIATALLGDSLTGNCNRAIIPTAVSWSAGRAVWTCAGHALHQGGLVYHAGGTVTGFPGFLNILSITDANTFVTNVPAAAASSGSLSGISSDVIYDRQAWTDSSWMMWANMESGGRFNIVANAGRGGDRLGPTVYLQTPLQRIDTEIAPYNPQVCFVMIGTNDLNDTSGSARTVQQIYDDLLAVCKKLWGTYGILPIVITPPPFGTGIASFAAVQARNNQYCHRIRSGAGAANGYMCIDAAADMTDFATGGAIASPATQVTGNIHFNKTGARIYGKAISRSFSLTTAPALLAVSSIDTYGTNAANLNLIDRGIWTASGGTVPGTNGVTGVMPAGWTSARLDAGTLSTIVTSCPARTVAADGDDKGFNIQAVMTALSAEAFAPWIRCADTIDARLVAGGTYELRMTMRLSGLLGSNLQSMTIQAQIGQTDTVSGFAYTYSAPAFSSADGSKLDFTSAIGPLTTGDGSFLIRSLPFTFAGPGAGSNNFQVRLVFSTTGTTLTAIFGRPCWVRIS